jgi:transposase, IS5 family
MPIGLLNRDRELIIKEKLGITNEETVKQIRKNHYLQYLIGKEGYKDEVLFDPTMMVLFRKKKNPEMLAEIHERIHIEQEKNGKVIKRLEKNKKLR